jgi:membrane associated rhomboid family serine protease
VSAFAAFALFNLIGVYEIENLKTQITDKGFSIDEINGLTKLTSNDLINKYLIMINTPMVGASGAIFGVMAAFTILFPNTVFYLYFAIPVKAKFLVGAYLVYTLYMILYPSEGDNTAHLAHLGGAIAGGIMVLYWRKIDRSNFW